MVSSGHCKGRGALSVCPPLSGALNLQYFGSGNAVSRLSYVVCCRQQQLTAFRRVWPLADWREISKISIHKNSQECAHSHVLGMYSYVPLSALSLSLFLCPSVHLSVQCRCACPAFRPIDRLSARQLFVTTSHSKGLHFTLQNAALTPTLPPSPCESSLQSSPTCPYFWLHQFDLANSFSVHLIIASTVCDSMQTCVTCQT